MYIGFLLFNTTQNVLMGIFIAFPVITILAIASGFAPVERLKP